MCWLCGEEKEFKSHDDLISFGWDDPSVMVQFIGGYSVPVYICPDHSLLKGERK